MKIAMVGFTGSKLDFSVMKDTQKLLNLSSNDTYDYISLWAGRDFLKEDKKYDVVVLIYVYRDNEEEFRASKQPLGFLNNYSSGIKNSSLHSPRNWQNRLLSTNAEEILIFGMFHDSEITGNYIGDLKGYEMNLIEMKIPYGPQAGFHYGSVWHYHKFNSEKKDIQIHESRLFSSL